MDRTETSRRRNARRTAALALACMTLAACASTPPPAAAPTSGSVANAPAARGTMRPYEIHGVRYQPAEDPDYEAEGLASWYGAELHGRPTASGETFDMNAFTAAHPTLPMSSMLEVTNLANGRVVIVRVNDRGPFSGRRIIDVSRAAAEALDFVRQGTARVRVKNVGADAAAGPMQTAGSPDF